MMDMKRFKNSFVPDFSLKAMHDRLTNLNTSVGIVECKTGSTNYGLVRKTGRKLEHTPATIRKLHNWFVRTARGERLQLTCNCIVRYKGEYKAGWFKTIEELDSLLLSCRCFFLPSFEEIMMAKLGSGPRQQMERGRCRIGQTWLYGGALQIAKIMNWDRKGFRWSKADILKMDKYIRDWLLMLYSAVQRYYVNFDNMTPEEKIVTERVLEEMAVNICSKVTCFPKGFWRILIGTMYSGGYETSNGDTWILLFAYAMYMAHEMVCNIHDAPYIAECLALGLLACIAYGDDHLNAWPPGLPYMTHAAFAKFCRTYLGLIMREVEEFDSFITVVNHFTGEIVKPGPVFLKRYFIASVERDLPEVVAWRPTHETILKLLLNANQTPTMSKIACLGMVYDTLGTNFVSYKLLEKAYEALSIVEPRTPQQICESKKDDPNFATFKKKFAMMCSMSDSCFQQPFPTYRELQERNISDPVRMSFTNYFQGYDDIFE
jgi:hypothetical protein